MGELFVSMCVLAKGGQVLRNLSPSGAVDLVIKLGVELYPIDVKVASWSVGGRSSEYSWRINLSKVPSWVYPVMVIPEGGLDFQQWQVRWTLTNGHTLKTLNKDWNCPPGLENFWSKTFSLINYTNETSSAFGL